jgi:hypothetical protein
MKKSPNQIFLFDQTKVNLYIAICLFLLAVFGVTGYYCLKNDFYFLRQIFTIKDHHDGILTGHDLTLPQNFPKDIPVFPNAKISAIWNQDAIGYHASIPSTQENAISWYRDEYQKMDWKTDLETDTGLTFSNDRYITVLIISPEKDNFASVNISKIDKSSIPFTTKDGEQDYDKAIMEAKRISNQAEQQ